MSQKFDFAVLGLGAMGSAVLYQLAKLGAQVAGIDQFHPPHTFGSTHGETRVTRRAIGEGHQYVPLAMRSHEIWRELEQESGEELLFEVGGLMVEAAGAGGDVHGASRFLDTTISAAKEFGIAHEVLGAGAIKERFPGFDVKDEDRAYFEPGAGYLKVEECVAAQLSCAQKRGATCFFDHSISKIEQTAEGVRLIGDQGDIVAKKLIVCAGSWLPQMLPSPFKNIIKTTRQTLHWYPIEPARKSDWQDHPIFIWIHGAGDGFYGLPSLADPSLIKVADAGYGAEEHPNHITRNVERDEQNHMFDRHLSGRLSGIKREAAMSKTCIYAVTPDSGFILDHHPENKDIFIVSACSGHGFKHSAAIGEAVSQTVYSGQSDIDLSAFKLSRFSA
jgi:sarcosine oxidase